MLAPSQCRSHIRAFCSNLSAIGLIALLLGGCLHTPLQSDTQQRIQDNAPFSLINGDDKSSSPISTEQPTAPSGWIKHFNDADLDRWLAIAITDNFSLAQARARVEAARHQRRSSASNLWPTLNLDVDQGRQKTTTSSTDYENSAGISASVAWEVDLWGKLSNTRNASDYRWRAEQARLDASKLSLSAQIAKAWFELIGANQLSELLKVRVDNLTTNLDIIQNGYRQGINNALDVYLAQSDLANESNNWQQQQAVEKNRVRQLQLLLGQYPSGALEGAPHKGKHFPSLTELSAERLTSQNVRHRPDLQASYLELLASNQELAVAHKNRFPSFRLTGNTGDSSDELKNLLDSSSLAWNLVGGLSQPLFSGGKLKALEQQQRAVVEQKQQQYLNTLYTAFNEVEQNITNESSLKLQLELLEASKSYAEAAEDLAFEEYRQGLQTYTSVLEAQRRAFNAQNSVISLRNQLLQNRINLYLALGGNTQ